MNEVLFRNLGIKSILLVAILFILNVNLKAQNLEVISSGGDYFENTNYKISWTIGEPISETVNSSQMLLTQGFIQYFSNPVSVPEIIDKSINLKIYPNPVQSYLFLTIESSAINETLCTIYSIYGTKLNSKILDKTINQIDVSNIQSGILYIQIINDQIKLNKTYKLIKL